MKNHMTRTLTIILATALVVAVIAVAAVGAFQLGMDWGDALVGKGGPTPLGPNVFILDSGEQLAGISTSPSGCRIQIGGTC